MKNLFLLLGAIMLIVMPTQAQNYNFEDYVYPFGCRTYASPDLKGNILSITQYSFESQTFDNFLIMETYIGYGVLSAKATYRYYIEDNAVISDVQLRQDMITGSKHYQDRLILFAFPEKDNSFKWTETDRGEKYQCTSEYVYIKASIYHKTLYLKSIKITRNTSYISKNKKHNVIETSYWVSNYGRIITYRDWDGMKGVSSQLDVLDYIQEISEEEYNTQIKK